jgi:hypothetical protein
VRDLVEIALGAFVVAGLVLAGLLLPSALIDMAAGTNLLDPAAMALLLVFSAAAILFMVVIWQGRHSDRASGRQSGKQGTEDRE